MHDFSGGAVAFNPATYGFTGMYPEDMWREMYAQYNAAHNLSSGAVFANENRATGKLKYPLAVNLFDFVAEVHATMVCGEQNVPMPPRTILSGGKGSRSVRRAQEASDIIAEAWNASNPAMLWTLFYNTQVYGGAPIIARYSRDGKFPLRCEIINPTQFYPVFDSFGNIIEFFICRRITHSEAKYRYGVTLSSLETPYYIEHWNPEWWVVKINNVVATRDSGTVMGGNNPLGGLVPAVYIPHIPKNHIYGDSQILPIADQVLDFNSRLADVSDGVSAGMRMRYWGRNMGTYRNIDINGVSVVDLGTSYSEHTSPEVFAFNTPTTIKEGMEFVDYLWDMILYMSNIPQVALGIDEGSQRSGQTLRARFWALQSHANIERSYATRALNELAYILVRMAEVHKLLASGAGNMIASQEWPEMLPQDRLELVNEMVQRRSANLVSLRTAVKSFGDYEDLDEELEAIEEEQQEAREAMMAQTQVQTAVDKKKEDSNGNGSVTKNSGD